MARLKNVERATHVAARKGEQGLLTVVCEVNTLALNNKPEALVDLGLGERREAEAVADNAEADVACVLLDDAAEGVLCLLGHGVGLVEDNKLEACTKDFARTSKVLDLFADDVDATVVGGVKLEDHGFVLRAVELARTR
ncbi:hypothetical protein BC937DRAFT_95532 [Endogone sp. FLAS-F59071]|nr:hypothetical protein BC937DRAFT_95532 [Endogone sp. FLAS-F59071]|eukprot:RUS13301.1 hypothetical protein BC937DRAFT_95532 [Endogone sp. FLAS-F59071]